MSHRTTLIDSQIAEGWQVTCDHCADGWMHDTKEGALEMARTHIGSLAAGTQTRVLVHRLNGTPEEEETNGADFVSVTAHG